MRRESHAQRLARTNDRERIAVSTKGAEEVGASPFRVGVELTKVRTMPSQSGFATSACLVEPDAYGGLAFDLRSLEGPDEGTTI